MTCMRQRWGPGKIALAGIGLILGWVIVLAVVEIVYRTSDAGLPPGWLTDGLGGVVWVVGALLILGAGLAKVIEIGVRSGRQE